jgi:putative hydrolase of the HAD superfamily
LDADDGSQVALRIRDRVVVFDYGEVISLSPSDRDKAELLSVAGVPDSEFWAPYWAHRDGLDGGSTSVREYWKLVASDLGVEWTEARIHELWVADFTGWLSVDPATFDVVADLHDGGTRVALLSNAGFDFASPFRFSPMARFFERMFISAELSKVKPDADIYLEVARELGITPEQMVFIDNKQVNVDGAVALGITGHHFVGAVELRIFLESISVR